MLIDIIEEIVEFERLQSNWDSVYAADPESQFFLSWIWLAQLLTRRPENWCVLAARQTASSDDYVAFLPLRLSKRFSKSRNATVDEVHMCGNHWADYTGLICRPEFDESAIPALATYLKKMNWAKLHFENIRASDRRIELLTRPFASSEFRTSYRKRTSETDGTNNLICPVVTLPGNLDDYLQDILSAKTRQKYRRFMRKVDASSDIEIVESRIETRERDLDALASFWKARWISRKGKKVDILAGKYRKIVEQGLEGNIVYLSLLLVSGRPVAAHASFVDKEKMCLLFFVAGRDISWNGLPSGFILHIDTIRWAIENGLQTYDLLRGNEPYKYSLGATDKRVVCILVEALTNKGTSKDGDQERKDSIASAD